MSEHPFWQLVRKEPKTDTDIVAIVGVEAAFVSDKYSHLTQEQVYDALLADAHVFALRPPAQSGKETP
jgi:hypothetical protein